jgi:hypothetical protein
LSFFGHFGAESAKKVKEFIQKHKPKLSSEERQILELEAQVRWYKDTGLQIVIISIILAFSLDILDGLVIQ